MSVCLYVCVYVYIHETIVIEAEVMNLIVSGGRIRKELGGAGGVDMRSALTYL